MEEKIRNLIVDEVKKLDVYIDNIEYVKENGNYFLRIIKNESFKVIHNELSECINYKLYQFDLNDLYIFLQFLYNVYDIIQNKLYLKKLIYFLPEIIISRIKYPISILHNISILITFILFLSVVLAVIFPEVSVPLVIILGSIVLFIAISCVIDNAIDEIKDR